MATFTQNVKFARGDTVTDDKLNNIIASATVSKIRDADLDASAGIVDTKLATISSPSKVNLSAIYASAAASGDMLIYDGTRWSELAAGANTYKLSLQFDSYTKTMGHFDGASGATTYTDEVAASAYTFVGTAQLDTDQKKFGTASLLLDGDSDYVTLPDSADWNFGTGDFTVEAGVRWSAIGALDYIAGQLVDDDNFWVTYLSSGSLWLRSVVGGVAKGNYSVAFVPTLDTWYHIAFARCSTSSPKGLIFVNGVKQTVTETTAFGTNDLTDLATALTIGNSVNGGWAPYYFNGYIDELRISKGVARWTGDFSVPTTAYSPSPYWVAP